MGEVKSTTGTTPFFSLGSFVSQGNSAIPFDTQLKESSHPYKTEDDSETPSEPTKKNNPASSHQQKKPSDSEKSDSLQLPYFPVPLSPFWTEPSSTTALSQTVVDRIIAEIQAIQDPNNPAKIHFKPSAKHPGQLEISIENHGGKLKISLFSGSSLREELRPHLAEMMTAIQAKLEFPVEITLRELPNEDPQEHHRKNQYIPNPEAENSANNDDFNQHLHQMI